MAFKPVARQGDTTSHGGVITTGEPGVLINGRPVATVGDLYTCPTCGVTAPIVSGVPNVLVNGKPIARVGDFCACPGPPSTIASGSPNVLVGTEGPADGAGVAAGLGNAVMAEASLGTPGAGATAHPLSPWVGVGYVDPEARSVTGWQFHAEGGGEERDGQLGSGGQVWADALAEDGPVEVGLVGLTGCRWAKSEARVGDEVGMSARCVGVEDGAEADFYVWREAWGSAERACVWRTGASVRGGRVEAERPFVFAWSPGQGQTEADVTSGLAEGEGAPPPPDPTAGSAGAARDGHDDGPPVYVCEVSVGGVHRAQGGPLRYRDWVEVEVVGDADDRPVARASCVVAFADGSQRTELTDGRGVARFESVPPGPYRLLEVHPPR